MLFRRKTLPDGSARIDPDHAQIDMPDIGERLGIWEEQHSIHLYIGVIRQIQKYAAVGALLPVLLDLRIGDPPLPHGQLAHGF